MRNFVKFHFTFWLPKIPLSQAQYIDRRSQNAASQRIGHRARFYLELASGRFQVNDHATLVLWIPLPLHQPGRLEPLEQRCQVAAIEQQPRSERDRTQGP